MLTDGISVDLSKVKVKLDWKRPKTIKKVQSFLGLARYYRLFMEGFAKLAKLLTKLTRNNVPFRWYDICKKSLEELSKG